jgi:F-type H+-transporting ATPase subunit gamma
MPATKDIRRRIKSIKSTRQITKAMELVSAAKMRKAQAQALGTRTYAQLSQELLRKLSSKIHPQAHALLRRPKESNTVAVIVIASNRGLIGGFNNNVINNALNYTKQANAKKFEFIPLGKKAQNALLKKGQTIAAQFEKKDSGISEIDVLPLVKLVTDDFVAGKYDRVVLVYMDFVSTLVQRPVIRELLPLSDQVVAATVASGQDWEDEEGDYINNTDYLFEPDPDQVLENLLPRLVEIQIYQALLETNAAEHSARMVTMKNATDAAGDLVDELIFEYNQLRQAAITKEISEIVSGQLVLSK